ncbi:MAG: acyl-CoA reductase [Chitinophagaceae bacterium]|nr:acyl-CoA reductase [Chitinophagaceae bacterium]
MNLPHRIDLLVRLGEYILGENEEWQHAKERASRENGWFVPEFIDLAVANIAHHFLQKDKLEKWLAGYPLPETNDQPRQVGIVMAGNIPLVGFHDWLAVFISGHRAVVKPSSKDQVLIKHLAEKMAEWEPEMDKLSGFADMLKGCDAYIATGSNNSSRYFEYYFGKYPHIIRQNRTSAAILTGNETAQELELLANDVFLYFGLGCRNVTKIYVPSGYDFIPLIEAFKKYNYLADLHKYKNNYDYNLALHLLNKKYYMSSGALLLVEEPSLFSPISQLNYGYYEDKELLAGELMANQELQCIVGSGFIPFGQSQVPSLSDYADGVDTLEFLCRL